jgi:hypothetical protein
MEMKDSTYQKWVNIDLSWLCLKLTEVSSTNSQNLDFSASGLISEQSDE